MISGMGIIKGNIDEKNVFLGLKLVFFNFLKIPEIIGKCRFVKKTLYNSSEKI